MRLERTEIQTFDAVVETGSFSRAAERLNVSQSAVSQTIANLEHKLDTRLLIRGAPSVPTEAGQRLFRFTRTVIREETSVLDDIGEIRTGALSTLNLAINSVVNRFHGGLLLEFCQQNPLTRLKLDVAPSREIVYGVSEDRWELGFGPFQTEMPGHLETHPFFEETRRLVVHAAHPMADDLVNRPDASLGQVTLLTSYLDDAAKRPGGERLRNRFADVWEVSNLELRLALCEAGMGVTHLTDSLRSELAGYRPIERAESALIERTVGLFFKRDKPLSEAARRFVALCQRAFANGAFADGGSG